MRKKTDKIAHLDEKIVPLIDDATEFESAVYEAEEFQDDIVDKIATATRFMELSAAKSSRRSQTPPSVTSLAEISESQPESTHYDTDVASISSVVDSGSVSATSGTMQAELVSALALSSDSTSSTAAPHVAISTISTTNISEICSAQPITPVTTVVYSTSLGPTPVIPADTYTIDSQHRPIASTLFAPRSVYNLPINPTTGAFKLISQCIHCVYLKISV